MQRFWSGWCITGVKFYWQWDGPTSFVFHYALPSKFEFITAFCYSKPPYRQYDKIKYITPPCLCIKSLYHYSTPLNVLDAKIIRKGVYIFYISQLTPPYESWINATNYSQDNISCSCFILFKYFSAIILNIWGYVHARSTLISNPMGILWSIYGPKLDIDVPEDFAAYKSVRMSGALFTDMDWYYFQHE